jgi:hypothetical protein
MCACPSCGEWGVYQTASVSSVPWFLEHGSPDDLSLHRSQEAIKRA